jgi:hydroxyacylglutathione hydrolase
MNQVAEDVWQIALTPRDGINAYLLGDVLVDAGTAAHGKKLVALLAGRAVAAHALTHAHIDHAGGSKAVTEALGLPLWVGAADAEAAETGDAPTADTWAKPLLSRGRFPGTPVALRLQEGDTVAGFKVLDTPGHSAGHVSYWRERDRVLVLGDVLNNMHLVTTMVGLRTPPAIFTPDPALNRRVIHRLAALEPALVLFGHGPPLRDTAKLTAFAAALAQ